MPMTPAAALLISNLPLSIDGGQTCFYCKKHPSDHSIDCPRGRAEFIVSDYEATDAEDAEFRAMYRQITGGK